MKGRWAAILSGWLVGGSLTDWLVGCSHAGWLFTCWLVVHMLVGWSEGSVGWHIEVFCRLGARLSCISVEPDG